ncbi:FCD domain-containing protein [Paraburkholderia bonniea]|uniref:FadR/GntR family transcriptional regulator n=1 Tax=Paraburkholderia bonniea TaxID=2152891 RepID=UPI0012928C6A|nr:FCD domain-containing protein [Paraburkholderia bonniea]WJF91916.1 FCD domain-containing protein [Paraburkholderia bonniea]WJF95235.1 FCD domain-containing protein [Paraburkholderia bonniea]
MKNKISSFTPLWEPVQTETLSWRIVSQVRSAVFSGQIKAGDFLGSETSLSTQFNVSRMAARDALRSLEAVGIVQIRMGAKGGAWIAQGNPERFADALAIQLHLIGVSAEEIFDAQVAIEVTSAELAAKNATPENLAKLHALLTELDTLRADPLLFTDASMRFHEAIVEASQNRVLLAQFRGLRFVLQPLLAPNTTHAIATRVIRSHKSVLSAIEAHDDAKAREIMLQRVKAIRSRVLSGTAILHPDDDE